MAGRWGLHANGLRYGTENGNPAIISPNGIAGNRLALQRGLEHTLQFLTQRNIKVTFVAQVPEIGWNVSSTLARVVWFGYEKKIGQSFEDYQLRQQPVNEILSILSTHYQFHIVNLSSVFCPKERCLIEQDGYSLYSDDNHLSMRGSEIVSALFKEEL